MPVSLTPVPEPVPDIASWLEDTRPLVVVLTGAGISQESGIPTFRDADGLWEGHDVMQVASPEGFRKDPELVLRFYNLRRAAAASVQPNAAHLALSELQARYNLVVVTQNIDDLHERGGNERVLHLHGRISQVRGSQDPHTLYEIGGQAIEVGDCDARGQQLRPNVVWFGEEVPNIVRAAQLVARTELLLVVGTSLEVYPAASLAFEAPPTAPVWVINPNMPYLSPEPGLRLIEEKATVAVRQVVDELLSVDELPQVTR